jgi:hypothetical protein
MKIVACLALILLAVIAYKVPTANEIGEGILDAQEKRIRKRESEAFEARMQAEARDKAASEAQRRARDEDLIRKDKARAQAEFDALPKWDIAARPINREPPPGLSPTVPLPPPPATVAPKRTPTPAEQAADVARKFGGKP